MLNEVDICQLVEQLAGRDWRRVVEIQKRLVAAGEQGMHAIIAGMSHPSPRVRRACAGFMDHFGDQRCVAGLTERLLTDPVPRVRREAVHALGCDRCKAAPLTVERVPLLMWVIENDSDKRVRVEAIKALNTSENDARYFPLLRDIVDGQADDKLRRTAHTVLYHRDPEYKAAHVARVRASNPAKDRSGASCTRGVRSVQ